MPDEIRPFPALSYQIAAGVRRGFARAEPHPQYRDPCAERTAGDVDRAGRSRDYARAGDVRRPRLRAAAYPGGERRVGHRARRFSSDVFLLRLVSDVRPFPCRPADVALRATADYRGRTTTEAGTTDTVTSRKAYLWSVALFFAALFSKQNTITLAPALVLFDLIVDRRRIELSWKWIRPYVPYVLLTAGFLLLRYVLFHEVAREGVLNAQRIREFLSDSSRHLVRLVFGGPGLRHWTLRDTEWVALGLPFSRSQRRTGCGSKAAPRTARIQRGDQAVVARRGLLRRDLDRARHGADPRVRLLLAAPHVSGVAWLGRHDRASRSRSCGMTGCRRQGRHTVGVSSPHVQSWF